MTRVRRSHSLSIAFSATSLVALGIAPATAFTLKEIGEWVVSCDNAGTCALVNASQLTQLRVAQPSPFGMSRVCIHRRAGPDSGAQVFVTLRTIAPRDTAAPRAARLLRIVGNTSPEPDIPMRYRGAEHWEVPPEALHGLLAGLDSSKQLHVVSADGTTIERLSLEGIDEALTVIDREQQRAGTVTALRDKGNKSASSVPAATRPQPLVTAPVSRLSPQPSPAPEASRLRREACGSPGLDGTVGYRLLGDRVRPDRTLWVTPCDNPAGLRRSYYVIENQDGSAAPVTFPGMQPERPTGRQGLLSVSNFNADTGQVEEQWREPVTPAPGKACAIQRLWGWNGRSFELAEERRSLSCAGIVTGYWPWTYRRTLTTPAEPGVAAAASSFRPPC